MKKIIAFIMLVALQLWLCIDVFASGGASWYCVRKNDHSQPTLSSELRYVDGYDLYWCDKNHSDFTDEEKVIYLTFDAGYENGNIKKIVDVLREEGVRATFFILDNMILKNEELVKQMIDDGHVIGNHTLKHKDMTNMKDIKAFARELTALEELYEKTYGTKMAKVYRPPEGKISEENLIWAKELGYKTVMWSFAYADWDNGKQPSTEFANKKIFDNLHNGEVMLLHPTSATNAEIMRSLVRKLKSQGYIFKTVDSLWSE